jgi:hypothetical protein
MKKEETGMEQEGNYLLAGMAVVRDKDFRMMDIGNWYIHNLTGERIVIAWSKELASKYHKHPDLRGAKVFLKKKEMIAFTKEVRR